MATPPLSETIHASCVAIGDAAVLLTGPSGAGKSDLALRLIDRGAQLVSDDYTIVKRTGDMLVASAPATIAGRIEARGIGILALPHLGRAPVRLVVALTDAVERLPSEQAERIIAGVAVPLIALQPFFASAPIKVELALTGLINRRS